MIDRDAYIVDAALRNTHKSLRQALIECDILELDPSRLSVETCDNCEVWASKYRLSPDRNGNLLCGFCKTNCGE